MHTDKRDFDQEAAVWDEHPTRVRLAKDIAGAIVGQGVVKPETAALDFGCGTGLVTLRLQPLVRSITGVDSSQGMLEVFSAKIAQLQFTNVRAQFCDPDQGDRLSGSYDLVVSSMTLHHIKEIVPLFAQFYAILAPGGYLCLADLDVEDGRFHDSPAGVFHYGFDREVLRQSLIAAGFVGGETVTASEIEKPGSNGAIRRFPVFLMTARKP
ncbi:MAG: class I SAM-dependent methyltransferase [Desulfobulbaceae bacterium]|nr:class I SAM-dependent methyltransferase [Desulfobulbaceae bacterium]